jgi:hypothetical protein
VSNIGITRGLISASLFFPEMIEKTNRRLDKCVTG